MLLVLLKKKTAAFFSIAVVPSAQMVGRVLCRKDFWALCSLLYV